MKKVEFAERQYEASIQNNLLQIGQGSTTPFVPAQHIEYYLGFDHAYYLPRANRIWNILSVNIPTGITLQPSYWPALPSNFHSEIPKKCCSLFFQYKIPKFQDGKKAKYFKDFNSGFFEVCITKHQQTALIDFENTIQNLAVVRYMAPMFWTRRELDTFDSNRTVLDNSAYISPGEIGTRHRKWMYSDQKTILNPEIKRLPNESWRKVIDRMKSIPRGTHSIADHVKLLVQALRAAGDEKREITTSWTDRIKQYTQQYIRLTDDHIEFLKNMSLVATKAAHLDLLWLILIEPTDEQRQQISQWNEIR